MVRLHLLIDGDATYIRLLMRLQHIYLPMMVLHLLMMMMMMMRPHLLKLHLLTIMLNDEAAVDLLMMMLRLLMAMMEGGGGGQDGWTVLPAVFLHEALFSYMALFCTALFAGPFFFYTN